MNRFGFISFSLVAFIFSVFAIADPAFAAAVSSEGVEKQPLNMVAIGTFLVFVATTLLITWWAAKHVQSRSDFLVAGGGLKPWQNGMAIAGDFMSAATFLGITGAIYFRGQDAFVLGVGIMVGWPLILMVIAERFRNLGSITFIDVLSNRLKEKPVRIMASCISLSIVTFYMIAQMVGAGTLIQILFGLDYIWAILIVGLLMTIYVAFGGMVATTWVQIIKASLLLLGGTYLTFAILQTAGFSFDAVMSRAADISPLGERILGTGGWFSGDPIAVATVALTMAFGVMGLPHILMRFFTVKDASDARQSVFYATSIMGYFYILILIIGLGAVFLLATDTSIFDENGSLIGGANMVAIHLSRIAGGDLMFGFMAAVCFATILAVVAGLTLSGAATIAHDLYSQVFSDGRLDDKSEVKVTRTATLAIGVLAILLGLAFEGENVAVTAALALAIGASVNCPIIILALYWKGLTTRGVVWGGYLGLALCVGLIVASPGVMVAALGYEEALFPYTYPTVISMPVTFLLVMLISWFDRTPQAMVDRATYPRQALESELGSNIAKPSGH
ncbi:MAG: cation/acetate symporter ActP [Alphaproteobacteria bacterium]|nr:cation/acetate symporter ActP [Alphaproteobacteria bacterium]